MKNKQIYVDLVGICILKKACGGGGGGYGRQIVPEGLD